MKWAIKTQRLFDGTERPLVRDALVIIENERIVAVGPAAQVGSGRQIDIGQQRGDDGAENRNPDQRQSKCR